MEFTRERMIRSGLLAAGVAFGAHVITTVLPGTARIFHLMQSSVAILAILSLAVLIVAHHRSEVRFLSQTQEEMILIGAFGLFWLAILLGFRAFRHGQIGESAGTAGYSDAAQTRSSSGAGGYGGRPSYCGPNAVYCAEEWYY